MTPLPRRHFLKASAAASSACIAALPTASQAQGAPKTARGPVLLTVSGAIGRGNRAAFDPALDQMMAKQGIRFDKAHAFDFAALMVLPAVTIKPTLEYDQRRHTLRGPLLVDVVKATGARLGDKSMLSIRAVDGYTAQVAAAEITRLRFLVATHMDAQPLALGGLGPLWTVFDADKFADVAAKPVNERFAACPWAAFHIEVRNA